MGVEAALITATLVSAGSAIMQGRQQEKMYEYQAEQAEADAETAKQAAELKAEKIRERARSLAASTRAAMAGSGVSVDSITANLINKDIIKKAEEDALLGVDDADSMANRLRAGASIDRLRGESARVAGYGNAASSAISLYGYARQNGWIKSEG